VRFNDLLLKVIYKRTDGANGILGIVILRVK